MKYTTLIFDMDGTIIDSNSAWNIVTEQFLAAYNIHPDAASLKAIYHEQEGLSIPDSCRLLKAMFNLPDDHATLIKKQEEIADALAQGPIKFVDGFEDFHKSAIDLQLKIGLATNAPLETLSLISKNLNLSRFFGHHMYSITHVNNMGKPHPAVYLHAAAQLQAHPKQCIAIEDSAHGIWAAKNAGIFCIGINIPEKAARIAHADMVVHRYQDINLAQLLVS